MDNENRSKDRDSDKNISSPAELDTLLQVISPLGWISICAIGVLILAAIIWGFIGNISTRVEGNGILIKTGGVFDVTALGSGQISDLRMEVGDIVQKGQVVARIAQHEIMDKIDKNRALLKELQKEYKEVGEFGSKDLKMQKELNDNERISTENKIKILEERVKWFKEKINIHEKLHSEGLITKQTYVNTRHDYEATKNEIEETRNILMQLTDEELKLKFQRKQELYSVEQKISETEREFGLMEDNLYLKSQIISPYTGRILEVMVDEGSHIDEGASILSLELVGKEIQALKAVIYLPASEGKKVRIGMKSQISPTTVKREEYGFMFGNVMSVSEYPATFRGMMRILKNEELAQSFSASGPPIEVSVHLVPSDKTISGYKWSTPKGPAMVNFTGTPCSVSITISEDRPIGLVIPLLKR